MSYQKATTKTAAHHYPRCYESHPPLSIGDHKIYGGNCSTPVVLNADVYVALQSSYKEDAKGYPWHQTTSFTFSIPDMGVPASVDEFKKLIDWLSVQLTAKKLVHVGCIGGHGRTGMVLAALVATMTNEKDAIAYVRENYCKKAVESTTQVDFLMKHFGVLRQPPVKGHSGSTWDHHSVHGATAPRPLMGALTAPMSSRQSLPKEAITAEPTTSPMSVWGASVVFVKPLEPATI